MHIIIASTRAPKVNGVMRGVKKLAAHFAVDEKTIHFETRDVQSGVPETPTSIEDLKRGAQQRAVAAFSEHPQPSVYSVGVEGGIFTAGGNVFLQSWVCVYDGRHCFFGSSGAVELPEALAHEVIEQGKSLGSAIDHFSKQSDVRSNQGTFGILTNNVITREASFEQATLCAMSPFFNAEIYGIRGNK